MRIAIAGAGIFGLSASCELAARGHTVTVHEDDFNLPGHRAASRDISKAIRHEYGNETAVYAPWVSRARELWIDLQREWGKPIFHQTGFLALSSGSFEPGQWEYDSFRVLSDLGHPVQSWDMQTAVSRFPGFKSDGLNFATYNPDAGWLDPMQALPALAARAENRGVVIKLRSRLESIAVHDADVVLLANGAWLDRFLTEIEWPIEVTRQHEAFFRPVNPVQFEKDPMPVWCVDIASRGFYGFGLHPSEGIVKAACHRPGPRADAEDDRGPDVKAQQAVASFVSERLAGLGEALAGRSCFYTNSPDKRFVFDAWPGKGGVFVAGCGSGHAFKFGPLLGEWAADLVEGKEIPGWFRMHADRRKA
ncbi:MAG: hypothetical protein COB53_10440 [Elusimicrobia bacterium]|nr:MAG: hypothetical protein COB53_10440 [Elusimicrobiota bacterium]